MCTVVLEVDGWIGYIPAGVSIEDLTVAVTITTTTTQTFCNEKQTQFVLKQQSLLYLRLCISPHHIGIRLKDWGGR